MRPIRDINYRFNGKIEDFTDTFKAKIDEIIERLETAKRFADRDCPYDAEQFVYAAQRSLRDAVEIVKKCSDNYEMTADALKCDAKPSDSQEKGHLCAIACAKKKWERTQANIKAGKAEDAQ